jgi:hypothetical protein
MSMPTMKLPTAHQLSRVSKVVLGKWYTCVDYEGNDLPTAVAAFALRTPFYECVNHLGGHVWVKPNEFREINSENAARITPRAKAELKRQRKA